MGESKFSKLRRTATFCSIASVLIGFYGLNKVITVYILNGDLIRETMDSERSEIAKLGTIAHGTGALLLGFSLFLLAFGGINLWYISAGTCRVKQ